MLRDENSSPMWVKIRWSLVFYLPFCDGGDEHDEKRSAIHNGSVWLLCKWVRCIMIECFIKLSMRNHNFEYFGKELWAAHMRHPAQVLPFPRIINVPTQGIIITNIYMKHFVQKYYKNNNCIFTTLYIHKYKHYKSKSFGLQTFNVCKNQTFFSWMEWHHWILLEQEKNKKIIPWSCKKGNVQKVLKICNGFKLRSRSHGSRSKFTLVKVSLRLATSAKWALKSI